MSDSIVVNPFDKTCPSRDVLAVVGGKWALLIVCLLKFGPQRTGSIMRSVSGVSQKMLTQTLRELQRSGVVERISYSEVPPRVEYKLTPLGETLSVLVLEIEQWVVSHYDQVVQAQMSFDSQDGD